MTLVQMYGGATSCATTVVTETAFTTVQMPKSARQLVSVRFGVNTAIPAINEGVICKARLASDDMPQLTPFEVLMSPISSTGISALGAPLRDPMQKYYVNAPLQGSERITPYFQSLISATPVIYAQCEMEISDMPPTSPQKHSKVGTLTTTGAAGTLTAGTPFQITGCSKIIELTGVYNQTTVIAADDAHGYFKWIASEFGISWPVEMCIEPVGGIVGATGQSFSHINRRSVDLPVQSPCNITDACYLVNASGTAGRFITSVMYV